MRLHSSSGNRGTEEHAGSRGSSRVAPRPVSRSSISRGDPSAGGKIEGIVADINGHAPGIPPCGSGELPGYTIGRVIGEGGFCKVHLGVHHFTREKVAIKMIDKGRLVEQADRRRVGREIRVLKRLSHQSVIRVFDVVESHSRIYVVMEYCEGGSLLDYVRGKKRLSEAEACAFMHQVLRGLENCHENGVVHRDIKLENLLLDEESRKKIIDFGLSAILQPGRKLRVHCGSPSYAAPEIVSRKLYAGPPVDVWSLGVVLFAMISGYLPFHSQHNNKQELCSKIVKGHYSAPDYISQEARDLLGQMLTVDPQRRITTSAIWKHPWMASCPQQQRLPPPLPPARVRVVPETGESSADDDIMDEMEIHGFTRARVAEYLARGDYNYATSTYYLMQATKQRLAKEAMKQQVLGSGLDADAGEVQAAGLGSTDGGAVGGGVAVGAKEAVPGARRASRSSRAGVNTSGGERGGAAGALPAQIPQRGGGVAAGFSDLVRPGSAPPSPPPKWDGRRLARQKDDSAEVLHNRGD